MKLAKQNKNLLEQIIIQKKIIEELNYKLNLLEEEMKLLKQNQTSLKVDHYAVSFKLNKDLLHASLQENMEPQQSVLQNSQLKEPIKTGSFDRLLELLSKGYEYSSFVEDSFARLSQHEA